MFKTRTIGTLALSTLPVALAVALAQEVPPGGDPPPEGQNPSHYEYREAQWAGARLTMAPHNNYSRAVADGAGAGSVTANGADDSDRESLKAHVVGK